MVSKQELEIVKAILEIRKRRKKRARLQPARIKRTRRRNGNFLGKSVSPLFIRQPQPQSPQQFQPIRPRQRTPLPFQRLAKPFSASINSDINSPFDSARAEFDIPASNEIREMEKSGMDGLSGVQRERDFLSGLAKREGLGFL